MAHDKVRPTICCQSRQPYRTTAHYIWFYHDTVAFFSSVSFWDRFRKAFQTCDQCMLHIHIFSHLYIHNKDSSSSSTVAEVKLFINKTRWTSEIANRNYNNTSASTKYSHFEIISIGQLYISCLLWMDYTQFHFFFNCIFITFCCTIRKNNTKQSRAIATSPTQHI